MIEIILVYIAALHEIPKLINWKSLFVLRQMVTFSASSTLRDV